MKNNPSVEKNKAIETFQKLYGSRPQYMVWSPGRVNLIGEHTDYNDGFVLPVALDREIWIALSPQEDARVSIFSLDLNETIDFSLSKMVATNSGWGEYVKGVTWALADSGYPVRGWRGVMMGNVPISAGLSSSAAMELATARAFSVSAGFDWNAPEMAKIGWKAEYHWVGVKCGIMDQMISATGKKNHAMLIDCRSLELQAVPLPPGVSIVILDTGTRRKLVESAYNERREQCEAGAQYFGVPALRDVELDQLLSRENEMQAVVFKRARHIVSENLRTLQAADAMKSGNAAEMGRLMNESHASLKLDFEVSSPALDSMVECSNHHPACYGARMTGAGFGGCAVALVKQEGAAEFATQVAASYQKQTGIEPSIYICQASDGTGAYPLG